jgi:hypothetical protein
MGMLQVDENAPFDGNGHLLKEFVGSSAGKPLDDLYESHISFLDHIDQSRQGIRLPVLFGNPKHPTKAATGNAPPSGLVSCPVTGQLLDEPRIGTVLGNLAEPGPVDFQRGRIAVVHSPYTWLVAKKPDPGVIITAVDFSLNA